jgi:hypothetical protein
MKPGQNIITPCLELEKRKGCGFYLNKKEKISIKTEGLQWNLNSEDKEYEGSLSTSN